MTKIFALIVAGGSGTRMGSDIPKPYLELGGVPIIRRSIEAFLHHPRISGVRVVIRREDHARYKQAVEDVTLCPCVVGGATRQESVRLGLEALAHVNPTHVLIHDAARPLVDAAMIERVVEGLQRADACFPALAVNETLKRAPTFDTVDRSHLFTAQTPQGFAYTTIAKLHQRHKEAAVTDDIALAELGGIPIEMVAGDARNIKLTTSADIHFAEKLL